MISALTGDRGWFREFPSGGKDRTHNLCMTTVDRSRLLECVANCQANHANFGTVAAVVFPSMREDCDALVPRLYGVSDVRATLASLVLEPQFAAPARRLLAALGRPDAHHSVGRAALADRQTKAIVAFTEALVRLTPALRAGMTKQEARETLDADEKRLRDQDQRLRDRLEGVKPQKETPMPTNTPQDRPWTSAEIRGLLDRRIGQRDALKTTIESSNVTGTQRINGPPNCASSTRKSRCCGRRFRLPRRPSNSAESSARKEMDKENPDGNGLRNGERVEPPSERRSPAMARNLMGREYVPPAGGVPTQEQAQRWLAVHGVSRSAS